MKVWAHVQHELADVPILQAFVISNDVVDIQQHIENRGYTVHSYEVEHDKTRSSKRIHCRKARKNTQQQDGWNNLLAAWSSNSP